MCFRTFVGPGHGSPIQLENADWWYIYHTWRYALVGANPPGRVMNIDKIIWGPDGWPTIGNSGIPSDTPQEIPF
jgi:xylan 1,4-beta-xylosidase